MAMLGLSVGIIAIAVSIGHAPLPALMALAAVTGLTYPALTGAWTAQLPPLVTPRMLPRAYSADAGTYSVASIIGPPAAAALLAVSMTAPLWLPAALLVLALIMLRFVPLAPRPRQSHHSLVSDLRHGMSTIIRRLSLRRTIIITTIAFGGQAAVFICSPLIAQQLTGSLAFTGVIFGCLAAGGVLAAGLLLRFPVTRPDATVIVTTSISGIALAAIAVAKNPPLISLTGRAMTGARLRLSRQATRTLASPLLQDSAHRSLRTGRIQRACRSMRCCLAAAAPRTFRS